MNSRSRPSPGAPAIGVEEELLLVDPGTGRSVPCADDVIATAGELGVRLRTDATRARVVTAIPPCGNIHQLRGHLLAARSAAAAAALRCGARLLAAGVPLATADNTACGCHVHVQAPDTTVRIVHHLRPWLPVLLALTANSAVHDGVDTGYASWRSVLVGSGTVTDEMMIRWDAERSTVDVRVGDVPSTVDETTLLAGLVRALVVTATQDMRAGTEAAPVDAPALRMAYWRAAHDGLAGRGVDLTCGRSLPAVDLLHRLVRHVRPVLADTGELHQTRSLISKVLAHGNGAVRQRQALRHTRTPAELVDTLAQHTVQDWWPHNAA